MVKIIKVRLFFPYNESQKDRLSLCKRQEFSLKKAPDLVTLRKAQSLNVLSSLIFANGLG